MCLTALAWQVHPRFPLVLAANRDEFHHRPTAPMQWWDDGHTLAGRDLQAGGTWLGISRLGRIGLITNVREPGQHREGLPSRGERIPWWLAPEQSASEMGQRLEAVPTNGFNLLGIDLADAGLHYWSNRHPHRLHLRPGIYGLSNASLDTPWPKLQRLKKELTAQLNKGLSSSTEWMPALFEALLTRDQPDDAALPSTGISMEWERHLGSVFIQTPDGRYGTRCSTLLVAETLSEDAWRLHVVEQNWDAQAQALGRIAHELTGSRRR